MVYITKEELLKSIADEPSIELLEETVATVTVYDKTEGKEITFTFQEAMSVQWLASKITISESATSIFRLSKEHIAEVLYLNLPSEHFMTLNRIFISGNESDYEKIEDILDAEGYGVDSYNNQCGVMLNYYNSVVINVNVIQAVSKEVFPEEYFGKKYESETVRGFWSTAFHEIRHLMLDTNIFLPEEVYPINLSEEKEVESFGNRVTEQIKYPIKYKK